MSLREYHNHVTRDVKPPGKCPGCDARRSPPAFVRRPRAFDVTIGELDRVLSEFLLLVPVDEADRQTIKHHADDLVGVGHAALKQLVKEK